MSERKLATIRAITDIQPIENADAIVCAYIDGWPVVIKINEYNVGDLVVYCEIDSWIPDEIAPFLSKGKEPRVYEGIRGERLRSIKLRGQISQGLIMPLSILPEEHRGLPVDSDVSEMLNIIKYDKPLPACLSGVAKGNFPTFVPKTDEPRLQNISKILNDLGEVYITEKLDGTSFTSYFNDGVFGVCSRNLDLKETEGNSHWAIARKLDLETKFTTFGRNLAIQGELLGNGIQGNKYNFNNHRLYVFSVYDIDARQYVSREEIVNITEQFGLDLVPTLKLGKNDILTVADFLKYAEGRSALHDVEREGVVVRSLDSTVSFKAISNKWLLMYD